MKIKFFGTAAYEGIPAVFCKCERCKKARELGGKDIRTRSQSMIDDKILIDFNEDTLTHQYKFGLDMRYVNTLLITHKHEDHLYALDLGNLRGGFSHRPQDNPEPFTIYSSKKSLAPIEKLLERINIPLINMQVAKEFEPFDAEGYKITAFPANHDYDNCASLFYSVEKDGKSILYALDTGYFYDSVWEYFEKNKCYFDLVVLDCTCMEEDNAINWHMGLYANNMVKEKMLSIGVADEKTQFVINHFSHNHVPDHKTLCEIAEKNGFIATYDGMEIEF